MLLIDYIKETGLLHSQGFRLYERGLIEGVHRSSEDGRICVPNEVAKRDIELAKVGFEVHGVPALSALTTLRPLLEEYIREHTRVAA